MDTLVGAPLAAPARTRLERFHEWLSKARLDGFVVGHLPNVRYLCGFTGSAGVLAVRGERAVVFTDARYQLQAVAEVQGVGVGIRIVRGNPLLAAGKWLGAGRVRRGGFEAAHLSVAARMALGTAGGSTRWRGFESAVESLREVKDASEIETMREAARLGSEVFSEVLPLVKPGVREHELAAEIEYRMRTRGAEGAAFETIVAFGERTALPHARPTGRALGENELVLFDWGAILRGYCCDLTRTFYIGRAPARIRDWYQAILEAQAAAREALRPGALAWQVDAAARKVLQSHGLARWFTHSTGHGLGLEVHEAPRLGRGQKQRIQAGNVVTVEPGVYREGIGGIRIEDDVLVTPPPADPEILTSASREFVQL